jgi:niacin transporter
MCELVVVSVFYFYGGMGDLYYQHGFFMSVLLLVGLGTVVHSMVDFEISHVAVLALKKLRTFNEIGG